MKLVSPVGWYVIFWVCGAAVFLAGVRVLWINPLLRVLQNILIVLERRSL
jgi:hypothetical protein